MGFKINSVKVVYFLVILWLIALPEPTTDKLPLFLQKPFQFAGGPFLI